MASLLGEAGAMAALHWHCPQWLLQLLCLHISTAAVLQPGGAYSRKEGATTTSCEAAPFLFGTRDLVCRLGLFFKFTDLPQSEKVCLKENSQKQAKTTKTIPRQ